MARTAFVDELNIVAVGGRGGDGVVRFLRERARPRGGPDGGDGGRGGNVLAVAEPRLNSFVSLRGLREIRARDGQSGGEANKHGANGEDAILKLPLGAKIIDADTGRLHAVLNSPGESVVLAQGGRGGLGNARFKSAVNRAPRRRTSGEPRETRRFKLEFQIPAQAAFCGPPNCGKSSLLRAMSAARPKVAAYPFTTTAPQLGFVSLSESDAGVVVADTPPLTEGAAQAAETGRRFARHLQSAELLVAVADASAGASAAAADFRATVRELSACGCAKIPKWLALNKTDALPEDMREAVRRDAESALRGELSGAKIFALSAQTGEGVSDLARAMLEHSETVRARTVESAKMNSFSQEGGAYSDSFSGAGFDSDSDSEFDSDFDSDEAL